MQYGHFDDTAREYVITTPRTPLPWINYLGSENFFTLLSNTAGGYAFYRDARLRRMTRYRYNNAPLDQEGFHFYVKDFFPFLDYSCELGGFVLFVDHLYLVHYLGGKILERHRFVVEKEGAASPISSAARSHAGVWLFQN